MESISLESIPNKVNKPPWTIRLRTFLGTNLGLAIIYLSAITLAEVITAIYEPRLGLVLHGTVLLAILLHATLWSRGNQQAFLLSQALAPLVRILSLALPLKYIPFVYWYALVGAPLLIAAFLTARVIGLRRVQMGLTFRAVPQQIIITLIGIGLGFIEYNILRPLPLASGFSLDQIWLPALILLIFTGFVEEVIFRGVMYYVSLRSLGRLGIIYVAAIFAVLHIGYKSWLDILFVFFVAVIFGWMAFRTGSILGVTLAHGLTNITLFLVFPFILTLHPPNSTLLPDQAIVQYTLEARSRIIGNLTPTSSLTTTSTLFKLPSSSPTAFPIPASDTPKPSSSPTEVLFPTGTPTKAQSATVKSTSTPTRTGTIKVSPSSEIPASATVSLNPSITPTILTDTPVPSVTELIILRTSTPSPANPNMTIVDDGDTGFIHQGGNLFVSELGFGGDFIWSNTTDQNATVVITWQPNLATCGQYQVDVYIPSGFNLTHTAFYQVGNRNGMTGHLVDQSANTGSWVTIGTYDFLPTSGSFLRLNNRTDEPFLAGLAIVFDAARWTRVGPCQPEIP